MLIISGADGEVLLEKRPATGIWAGLWIFPQIELEVDALTYCRDELQLDVELLEQWRGYRHTFSHYHLDIAPLRLQLRRPAAQVMEAGRYLWYNLRAPAAVGLATPVIKLMGKLAT
jgi:A/G-specific adenine glycosylase